MPSEKPPVRLRATSLQPDQVQHLVHPAARQALGLGEEQQVVAGAAARVHGPGLEQRADRAQRLGQVARSGLPLIVARAARRPVQAERSAASWWTCPRRSARGTRSPCPGSTVNVRWSTASLSAVALGEILCLDHVIIP